ncbi:MAG TPA: hypothetical protein VF927_08600, partial [Solirubrobacteraceae bacterium]
MRGLRRHRRLSLGLEMALAFGVGAASFALTAIAIAPIGARWLALLPGVAFVAAIAAVLRYGGAAYAVPAAI